MLGYAYQNGGLPLSAEAVEKAIEMNGEAVKMNIAAFRYGRRAAVDPQALEALIAPQAGAEQDSLKLSQSFGETRRSPRRLPHRLPEQALCAAL